MSKRHLLVPCALLSLALAACGGGGDSSDEKPQGGDDQAQVEATIHTAVISHDPSKCTELTTQTFLDQTTGSTGDAALKECEREAKDTSEDPESVTISGVEVNGDNASADVAFAGSGFDGQTLAVVLVKDDGRWKLDKIAGFADLDKARLAELFRERLEATGELTDAQTQCMVGGLEKASQAELEDLVLAGSSKPFEEFAEHCA